MRFIVFFITAILILAGIHFYLYFSCRNLFKNAVTKLLLKIVFTLGVFLFPLSHILEKTNNSFIFHSLSSAGNIWLGFVSISLFIFLCIDAVFFALKFFGFKNKKFATTLALGLSLSISIFSIINAARDPVIKDISVLIPNLSTSSNGLSIVQLSDIHLDTFSQLSNIEKIISKTNSLNPDVVVITGDIIDSDFTHLEKFCGAFKNIKSRYGVFAISGNHDFYSGIDNFYKFCKKSEIKIFSNSGEKINNAIFLCGIPDKESSVFGYEPADIKTAIKQNSENRLPIVLLSHRPDIFEDASKDGVNLVLAGHLHAGQIPPLDIGLMLFSKYFYGLYVKDGSSMYLSPGTGLWGPPMRLLSKSEITKITLRSGLTDKNQ